MSDPVKEINASFDVSYLLDKWIETASSYSKAHHLEAIKLKKLHTRIGAPSVALSAIVGTSIFATFQNVEESSTLKLILAFLSMLAACLAALVTFLNASEESANHKIASEEYDEIARRLDILKTSVSSMIPKDWRNVLEGYSQRLEAIGRRANLPESMIVNKQKLGSTGFSGITELKFPREGFPDELEVTFERAKLHDQLYSFNISQQKHQADN